MNGLDTNVLVRYLVQDDREQAARATQFIEQHCQEESPGFINAIVICELVWVLESCYHYTKPIIVDVLKKILATKQFLVHDADNLHCALQSYQHGNADFSDFYIAALNRSLHCQQTVSFDKKAAKAKCFKLL
jgi:predicted nucleic-acid-binding protein